MFKPRALKTVKTSPANLAAHLDRLAASSLGRHGEYHADKKQVVK